MALDYDEWMTYGIKKGWCGPPVCYTHDGLPMSEQEDVEFGKVKIPAFILFECMKTLIRKKKLSLITHRPNGGTHT